MSDRHICIVDDDEDDIFLMSASLKRLETKTKLRFRVSTFFSGEDAISFFTNAGEDMQYIPDCICLDINMPGINGLELLSKLRQMTHLTEVPIYIVSTTKNNRTHQQALSSGANGTFAKPDTMLGMQKLQRELLGIPE
ncbi:response regulator [Hoeflea sp.]|uniref:response regulator n=1 Tax=Hoeflea sp. TaxID=1940281 RepID=UPI003A92D96A